MRRSDPKAGKDSSETARRARKALVPSWINDLRNQGLESIDASVNSKILADSDQTIRDLTAAVVILLESKGNQ